MPTPALTPEHDLTTLTLKHAGELLRSGAVSPVDLTQSCLERIERSNPALNAFISVCAEQALAAARLAEAEQQRGTWRGPLHGIPIAVKDNIDTAGIRTTAASELFHDRIPSEDAEVVRRLKEAGAIILGKTNLHEFAYGGTSATTYFKPVRNPWALDRIPGGSSGGSASATAACLCYGSLGTDTAGSVRIPAAYCGIVGFKPTFGRVSNRGVIPLSWTLDHVGPICRTVEDAALMLNALAGYDDADPTTVNAPVDNYPLASGMPVSHLRLAVISSPFFDELDADIAAAVNTAIGVLRGMAASVGEVTLPQADMPLYRAVQTIETYTYHAQWVAATPEKYQPETRGRIIGFAAGFEPADYVRARNRIELLRREIKKVFASVDLIVTPTMPGPPVLIEDARQDSVSIRNTSPFNIFGLPAISVPCGLDSAGLPIGLQIAGAPFAENTILALAHAYEQATEWRHRRPHWDAA